MHWFSHQAIPGPGGLSGTKQVPTKPIHWSSIHQHILGTPSIYKYTNTSYIPILAIYIIIRTVAILLIYINLLIHQLLLIFPQFWCRKQRLHNRPTSPGSFASGLTSFKSRKNRRLQWQTPRVSIQTIYC